MKKILLTGLMFIMFIISSFGQYQNDIYVNPNQSKNKQYIAIALGGKQIMSNQRLPNSRYDTKGNYSSVYLPDFIAAIAEELNVSADIDEVIEYVDTTFATIDDVSQEISDSLATVITIEDVRGEISDSLATVSGGGELPYYELTVVYHHDGDSLIMDTILQNTFPGEWDFAFDAQPENGFELNCVTCTGIDFTGHADTFIFGSATVYLDGVAPAFGIVPYKNGALSIGFVCTEMDGTACISGCFDSEKYLNIRYFHN